MTESSFPSGRPGVGAACSDLLDPADGIARVMGDRALYLRMLRRFCDDHQDAAARIRAAVDSGETRLAHRMAHTLEGASGMICAGAVHRLAGALDIALRGGAVSPPDLDAIEAALDELLSVIDLMLGAEATPPLTPKPKPARRSEDRLEDRLEDQLVERLAALLAGGDGAAVDLVEESGEMLTAALGEAGVKAVALAVSEFDFEGALETLRQAAQTRRTAAET